MKTLSDLVFHFRDFSAGRTDLISIKRRGRVEQISTADFVTGIHSLALGLEHRGVKPGDRIALFAENCPEWHLVDFACHLLGAVCVPIYPTLNAEQVAFILRNSGADWTFYSGSKKWQMLEAIRGSLSRPMRTVALDDGSPHRDQEQAARERGAADLALVSLQGEGAQQISSHPLERFRDRVHAEDLASLIYTSGTTGEPKGVMLSHRNFVFNVLACQDIFPLSTKDQALSFLPLSHVFERTVDYLFFYRGVAIHYAPSIERMPPLLPEVRPTVLTSVPRVYERAYLKVMANMVKETPRKQRIFGWAVRVGQRHATASLDRFIGPWLGAQRLVANRLIYRKIKQRFGGRLRFAISGGAPLGEEVAEFFDAVGIQLFQGYGLTETAPVLTTNRPNKKRRGSVGVAVPGVELKIAEDGEILALTPGLMKGYWENPEGTRELIDDDGWLHTGDVGHLDEDGFLFITDRKKDLLITSGGKNVAPQPIEQLLISQWSIAQAVVVGDRFPFLTALIVPRFEELPADLQDADHEKLIEDPRLERIIKAAVAEVNERLSDHERIRKWRLLGREFSLEENEITPTLKVRRRVIIERYHDLISSMYLKTQQVSA